MALRSAAQLAPALAAGSAILTAYLASQQAQHRGLDLGRTTAWVLCVITPTSTSRSSPRPWQQGSCEQWEGQDGRVNGRDQAALPPAEGMRAKQAPVQCNTGMHCEARNPCDSRAHLAAALDDAGCDRR